jgi:endonuclease/exonuclease/phosphatase (EEP) superfamily protein YafD
MTPRLRSALGAALAWGASGLLAAALVLHLTIRDRSLRFSPFYYAMPWPVMALIATALALYWWRGKSRPPAWLHLVAALAFAVGWLVEDWVWRPVSTARGELRVVSWNVARPNGRHAGVARWLREQQADVIAIAERQPRKKDLMDHWHAAFPDYQFVVSEGEMLCLIRGEVLSTEEDLLREGSYGTLIHARIRGREVTIVQADVAGYPGSYRGVVLDRLREIMAENSGRPFLLLGDFNTPHGSQFFRAWRQVGADAFESAGRGCAATWPAAFPVLSIDHLWSSPRLKAVRCELHSSWRSDHRAIVAEFDFAP